jgi:hypothetical protein
VPRRIHHHTYSVPSQLWSASTTVQHRASLQSARAAASSSSAPAEPPSVNERIAQLRREQAPRATAEQRDDLASLVSSRTVPPELRRILHMPEVDAPNPKPGTRTPRLRGRGVARPPPGPAAPSSWLHTSRHAPAPTQLPATKRLAGGASPRLGPLARTTGADFPVCSPCAHSNLSCAYTAS